MSIIQTIIIVILVPLITSILVAKRTNEYAIRKSFYKNNISIILKFYSIHYAYYRLCQQVTLPDIIIDQSGNRISAKEYFKNNLGRIIKDLADIEGKIRLILPKDILEVHDLLLIDFNTFRDTMYSYNNPEDKPKEKLITNFKKIDKSKINLEKLLKKYLRSEKII